MFASKGSPFYRNMFLAAAPYFQHRFHSNKWILANFQSSILSVSTVTNLLAVFLLSKMQEGASYPRRIGMALVLNMVVLTLLAISTSVFKDVAVNVYFGFVLAMVTLTSIGSALSQNGLFAYVNIFATGEYTQALMTGQAVAGVLPCIAQMISVVAVRAPPPGKVPGPAISSRGAFGYFMAAVVVSGVALFALSLLLKRESAKTVSSHTHHTIAEEVDAAEHRAHTERRAVGLLKLFSELRFLAMALFLVFAFTMFFPVFTVKVHSVNESLDGKPSGPRFFGPETFIPFAFLVWNSGDLIGRLLTLSPTLLRVANYPRLVFHLAALRVLYIPLYYLCNINGRGAVVSSDFFYLALVQLTFGISNGFIGSICMMSAPGLVKPEEREAAGGFMSLMLAGGLSVGSLLSFAVA